MKSMEEESASVCFTLTTPPLLVAAPDEASSIVCAAQEFGEKWTAYRFYAYCDVFAEKDGVDD